MKSVVDEFISITGLRRLMATTQLCVPSSAKLPAITQAPLDRHPTNIISQWRDEWKSAPVVNSALVDDATIRLQDSICLDATGQS